MTVYSTDYQGFSRSKHAHAAIPVGRAPRTLDRADGIVVVKHHIPVDPIPPALQVLVLSRDTVVHHPGVLPGVNTQNGLNVDGTGGQVLLILGMGTHRSGELVAERCVGRVGGHVNGLPPRVGSRVGRAGVVGAEDLHQTLALEVLGEPDEAGAEHGAGGGQEVELEGFDGGARVDDILGKLFGDLGGSGGLQDKPSKILSRKKRSELLTMQLKKKWLLWAIEA